MFYLGFYVCSGGRLAYNLLSYVTFVWLYLPYERHWGISPLFLYFGKVCVCAKSLQLCLTQYGPVDCTLPVSSVHGILQALEWVTISSSRGSSQPRDQMHVSYVSCIGRWVLYHQCQLGIPEVCVDENYLFLQCLVELNCKPNLVFSL